MGRGDGHGVGHLGLAVDHPVGLGHAPADLGAEECVVVVDVQVQDPLLRERVLADLQEKRKTFSTFFRHKLCKSCHFYGDKRFPRTNKVTSIICFTFPATKDVHLWVAEWRNVSSQFRANFVTIRSATTFPFRLVCVACSPVLGLLAFWASVSVPGGHF